MQPLMRWPTLTAWRRTGLVVPTQVCLTKNRETTSNPRKRRRKRAWNKLHSQFDSEIAAHACMHIHQVFAQVRLKIYTHQVFSHICIYIYTSIHIYIYIQCMCIYNEYSILVWYVSWGCVACLDPVWPTQVNNTAHKHLTESQALRNSLNLCQDVSLVLRQYHQINKLCDACHRHVNYQLQLEFTKWCSTVRGGAS